MARIAASGPPGLNRYRPTGEGVSLFNPEACDDLYCDVKVAPRCDYCEFRRACDRHTFRQPDGTRACRTCHYSGRPGRNARGAVDRTGSVKPQGVPSSPLLAALSDMQAGQRPLSDAEKESFRGTMLDEWLTVQDELVVDAVGEFLGKVKDAPAQVQTGSTRVQTAPARFLRAAQFEVRPFHASGWSIWVSAHHTSSEGTVHYPEQRIVVCVDGTVLAYLYTSEGLTQGLPTHHQVEVRPGQSTPQYGGRHSQWYTRSDDPRSGLPFNVDVHRSTIPELVAGRWAGSNVLTHPKFDEKVPEDATATGNWFVLRLAAYLDDPNARRDQWAQRI